MWTWLHLITYKVMSYASWRTSGLCTHLTRSWAHYTSRRLTIEAWHCTLSNSRAHSFLALAPSVSSCVHIIICMIAQFLQVQSIKSYEKYKELTNYRQQWKNNPANHFRLAKAGLILSIFLWNAEWSVFGVKSCYRSQSDVVKTS